MAKAAISHLQLALGNLEVHLHSLDDVEDCAALSSADACLRELTSKRLQSKSAPSLSQPEAPPWEEAIPSTSVMPFASSPEVMSLPGMPFIDETTAKELPMVSSQRNTVISNASKEPPPPGTRRPSRAQLMDAFEKIDADGNGEIQSSELREAITRIGFSPAQHFRVMDMLDHDGNGRITSAEWSEMAEHVSENGWNKDLADFTELAEAVVKASSTERDEPKVRFMLFFDSIHRVLWDVFLLSLLCYIAISLPFMVGFKDEMPDHLAAGIDIIEIIIDIIFLTDVALNFRTTYIDREGLHVTDGRAVAVNYLMTWFALDLLSSAPIDLIFRELPNLQVVKLLKIGKAAKALRMLKFGRLFHKLDKHYYFEELMANSKVTINLVCLSAKALCLCHWLACFMPTSGKTYLDFYFAEPNIKSQLDDPKDAKTLGSAYIAAMYWAMTTMTTVGYGDIVPNSDGERVYTMFAMIIGGGFYGYAIGSITSVMSTTDANTRAYQERLDLIHAWLHHHSEIPTVLVRRIRRHFKQVLASKTALEDAEILKDLSPELRSELSSHIISDEVRYNFLFDGMSFTGFAKLVPILCQIHVDANERIVTSGEPGVAMFIVLEGTALMTRELPAGGTVERKLERGDSFGEEIILGISEKYSCTVVATSEMTIRMIQEIDFQDSFASMPDVMEMMRENFTKSSKGRQTRNIREDKEAETDEGEGSVLKHRSRHREQRQHRSVRSGASKGSRGSRGTTRSLRDG